MSTRAQQLRANAEALMAGLPPTTTATLDASYTSTAPKRSITTDHETDGIVSTLPEALAQRVRQKEMEKQERMHAAFVAAEHAHNARNTEDNSNNQLMMSTNSSSARFHPSTYSQLPAAYRDLESTEDAFANFSANFLEMSEYPREADEGENEETLAEKQEYWRQTYESAMLKIGSMRSASGGSGDDNLNNTTSSVIHINQSPSNLENVNRARYVGNNGEDIARTTTQTTDLNSSTGGSTSKYSGFNDLIAKAEYGESKHARPEQMESAYEPSAPVSNDDGHANTTTIYFNNNNNNANKNSNKVSRSSSQFNSNTPVPKKAANQPPSMFGPPFMNAPKGQRSSRQTSVNNSNTMPRTSSPTVTAPSGMEYYTRA